MAISSASSGPPRITQHPASTMVARGEPVTLDCRAEGTPAPIITWFHDGQRVDPMTSGHRMVLPDGSLFFLSARHGRREQDGGVYECVAENAEGKVVSNEAVLTVACKFIIRRTRYSYVQQLNFFNSK